MRGVTCAQTFTLTNKSDGVQVRTHDGRMLLMKKHGSDAVMLILAKT